MIISALGHQAGLRMPAGPFEICHIAPFGTLPLHHYATYVMYCFRHLCCTALSSLLFHAGQSAGALNDCAVLNYHLDLSNYRQLLLAHSWSPASAHTGMHIAAMAQEDIGCRLWHCYDFADMRLVMVPEQPDPARPQADWLKVAAGPGKLAAVLEGAQGMAHSLSVHIVPSTLSTHTAHILTHSMLKRAHALPMLQGTCWKSC